MPVLTPPGAEVLVQAGERL